MSSEIEITTEPQFEEDSISARAEGEQLLLDLEGFDGPIDMLLSLARDQKVDLTKISILALANQYIDFIEKATELRLELAADYLVMASWLAYLKSRMLIPEEENTDEPSGEMMAEALAFQLRRLESIRGVSDKLMGRPQLGLSFFARGAPEGLKTISKSTHDASLYDLLKAYGDIQQRKEHSTYHIHAFNIMSIDEMMERFDKMLGQIPKEWIKLNTFLPRTAKEKVGIKSEMASTFGASLELAKRGDLNIQQEKLFSPIYIRKSDED